MALALSVQPGSPVPIYRQIVEHVCAAIFAGQVGEDEPLPSVRALADQLVVNPNTVSRAYGELVREGIIESRAGRGMFVSRRRQIYSRPERTRRMEQLVTSLVTDGLMLGFNGEQLLDMVADKVRELDPATAGKPVSRKPTQGSQRGAR